MATSIGSLQLEPVLRPFRKVEIRRREGIGYESNWYDVSKLVLQYPTINFEMDTIQPFVFNIGSADLVFRNEDKQFASEIFPGSIFAGKLTRYKTLVKISTGLKDETGTEYPTDKTIFYGMFSDQIVDGMEETQVSVNSIQYALQDFAAANVAPSVVGISLTSKQIIQTIRDYQDSFGNAVLSPFFSVNAWLLTTTGRTYTIDTTTSLDGKSAFDLMSDLAIAENYVFYVNKSGNILFIDRNITSTAIYNFNGDGAKNVNIESIDGYDQGISKVYNKFVCTLPNDTTVHTQESWNIGDNSSSWKYGQRTFEFSSYFVSNATAGSICSDLLLYFVNPKKELQITTKFIAPNLDLKDRVTVTHKGKIGGDGSTWDNFLWDYGLWSDEKGGIFINGTDFYITGISINLVDFVTSFKLKEV